MFVVLCACRAGVLSVACLRVDGELCCAALHWLSHQVQYLRRCAWLWEGKQAHHARKARGKGPVVCGCWPLCGATVLRLRAGGCMPGADVDGGERLMTTRRVAVSSFARVLRVCVLGSRPDTMARGHWKVCCCVSRRR